jgi:hypothetical protein
MTTIKTHPQPIGDDLPITSWQVKRIMQNCSFQVDIKNEWVQWATADVNRTSLKSITQAQARKIILAQQGSTSLASSSSGRDGEENWGNFDKDNHQHRYIASLLRNANIVIQNNKWGEVADMLGWLNRFLKSNRSPVQKPLKKMTKTEVSKIIVALEGVAVWKNSI